MPIHVLAQHSPFTTFGAEMSSLNSERLNSFGTASIPKLVLQFSVPAIISMLVNALYNVVDRFFVGQGVGSLGIAGITLCFPICLFIMAMSMMVGEVHPGKHHPKQLFFVAHLDGYRYVHARRNFYGAAPKTIRRERTDPTRSQ